VFVPPESVVIAGYTHAKPYKTGAPSVEVLTEVSFMVSYVTESKSSNILVKCFVVTKRKYGNAILDNQSIEKIPID